MSKTELLNDLITQLSEKTNLQLRPYKDENQYLYALICTHNGNDTPVFATRTIRDLIAGIDAIIRWLDMFENK